MLSCRCVNSSASQRAISSEASGLFSFGLKSQTNVSRIILTESTSSPSFLKLPIKARRESDATEAGYSFAKLRSPNIAARRSSRSVEEVRRLESVFIVSDTDCFAGVAAIANIALSGVYSYLPSNISLIVVGVGVVEVSTLAPHNSYSASIKSHIPRTRSKQNAQPNRANLIHRVAWLGFSQNIYQPKGVVARRGERHSSSDVHASTTTFFSLTQVRYLCSQGKLEFHVVYYRRRSYPSSLPSASTIPGGLGNRTL
jgi:hypothetical protein